MMRSQHDCVRRRSAVIGGSGWRLSIVNLFKKWAVRLMSTNRHHRCYLSFYFGVFFQPQLTLLSTDVFIRCQSVVIRTLFPPIVHLIDCGRR